MLVSVRYFAGAAAAAGTEEEKVRLAAGATVAGLVGQLVEQHPRLSPVFEVASLLLDEVAVRDRGVVVPDGATVDVLPPFAGG